MDCQEFQLKAIEFMVERGWDKKIAKNRGQKQSLFDHSLSTLNTVTLLLETLKENLNITETEELSTLVGSVFHDAGKATDTFQRYILGDKSVGVVYDTDKEIALNVSKEFLTRMGVENHGVLMDAVSGILLHMYAARTPSNMLSQLILKEHNSPRWSLLADIIQLADQLASRLHPKDANDLIQESLAGQYLHSTYYLIQPRSYILMTILHKSLTDAYERKGWKPFLYFSDGTVFISTETLETPTLEEIKERVVYYLCEMFRRDLSDYVVGKDVRHTLLFPEFFDYACMETYLKTAASRVSRRAFLRAKNQDEVVRCYMESIGEEATPENVKKHTARINAAYPEMVVFRFFKEAHQPEITGNQLSPDALEYYRSLDDFADAENITPVDVVRYEFEKIFGEGSYKLLTRITTFNPRYDMQVVDLFWNLSPEKVSVDMGDLSIEKFEQVANHELRTDTLIHILCDISSRIFNALHHSTREKFDTDFIANRVAELAMQEINHPSVIGMENIKELAKTNLRHYANSKQSAFSSTGEKICPNCNRPFTKGEFAKSELFVNPTAFTNRYPAHAKKSNKNIVICPLCQMERYMFRFLVNTPRAVVIQPRPPVGRNYAQVIQNKVTYLFDEIQVLLAEVKKQRKISKRYRGNLTASIQEKLLTISQEVSLSQVDWLERGRQSRVTSKRNALEAEILQTYGMDEWDMERLNEYWGTDFPDQATALETISSSFVDDDDLIKIRAKVDKCNGELPLSTPNILILPWPDEILMDEGHATTMALKELYIGLLIAVHMSVKVSIVGNKQLQALDFKGGLSGAVQFMDEGNQATRILRSMLTAYYQRKNLPEPQRENNVIPLEAAEDLLHALHTAMLLTPYLDFPYANGLYECLRLANKNLGGLVRRVEAKKKLDKQMFSHVLDLEPFCQQRPEWADLVRYGAIYVRNCYPEKLPNTYDELMRPLSDIFFYRDESQSNNAIIVDSDDLLSRQKRYLMKVVRPILQRQDKLQILAYIRDSIYYNLRKETLVW